MALNKTQSQLVIQLQTLESVVVWDFSKVAHKEREAPREVSCVAVVKVARSEVYIEQLEVLRSGEQVAAR